MHTLHSLTQRQPTVQTSLGMAVASAAASTWMDSWKKKMDMTPTSSTDDAPNSMDASHTRPSKSLKACRMRNGAQDLLGSCLVPYYLVQHAKLSIGHIRMNPPSQAILTTKRMLKCTFPSYCRTIAWRSSQAHTVVIIQFTNVRYVRPMTCELPPSAGNGSDGQRMRNAPTTMELLSVRVAECDDHHYQLRGALIWIKHCKSF